MIHRFYTLVHMWHLLVSCALAAGAVALPSTAHAQQVVVIVSGEPITTLDIANRSKLIQLTTRQAPSRQSVIDELIDEKLKVTFAKRYRLEASDTDIESTFSDMARRMRQTPEGLSKTLTSQGVDPYTLKDRIRAEMVWQQIVRGKYQSSMQVSEKEVASALEARKKDDKGNAGTEYTLRPILFVVARGSGEGAVEARKRDAETLKTRFENCDTGIRFARGLRDTIVRAPISKTSAELAPALREILDKTPVGHLTDPEITSQGVEIFAVCEKKEVSLDDSTKKQIQTEKFTAQFQENSKKLMKTLRAGAMIEYKEQPKDESNAPRASRHTR
jgi:peptidyl-prolyl cis-trans isomerase SurA